MSYRLTAVFLIIVLAPLALLGGLGARLIVKERETLNLRFRQLLEERLRAADEDMHAVLEARKNELAGQPALPLMEPAALREMARRSAVFLQFFRLDEDGKLIYPNPRGDLSVRERRFIERSREIWERGALLDTDDTAVQTATPTDKGAKTLLAKFSSNVLFTSPPGLPRFYTWYTASGLHLLCWWHDDSGYIVGAELNSARLLADLIAALPETSLGNPNEPLGRIVLVDEQGQSLYEWGPYSPADRETPRASLSLSPPLQLWHIDYYAPEGALPEGFGHATLAALVASLCVAALVVLGFAVYFYRENSRELREARRRISFVNHVSHELKTPLTNIRMYAELLEGGMDESDARSRKRLAVVVQESQRLSRLIANVLSFSRKQRSTLKLNKTVGRVDETLASVVEQFAPSLRDRGIEPRFRGSVPEARRFDADALGQIVGNLLSNVEKYAQGASHVDIGSRGRGAEVEIIVADNGVGIAPKERGRVFAPFYRVSNRLTDGVAGTGIGLGLARDLAQLHGGDVVLREAATGAAFGITIEAETIDP